MNPDQIAEIKKAHTEAFAAKRAVGLTEAQAAQAILAQLDHDAQHPPEDESLRRVKAAVEAANVQERRMQTARREAVLIIKQAKEQFPNLDLDSIAVITNAAQDALAAAPKKKAK